MPVNLCCNNLKIKIEFDYQINYINQYLYARFLKPGGLALTINRLLCM